MRVVAYVLSVLVMTALMLLGGLGFALLSEPDSPVAPTLGAGGLALALSGPITIGGLAAWWQRGQADGGRYFRRWQRWITVVAVVGVAMVVVGGLLARTPLWFLAIVVVVSVALLAIAAPVGARVRRAADRDGPRASDAWTRDNRVEVRRVIRAAAITFGVATVVAAIAAVALTGTTEGPFDPEVILVVLPLPFIASGAACSIAALRMSRRARALAGNDFARLRMLTRVVLKGADDEIDEQDRAAAARYAVLAPALLGTQLGFLLLLYTGLGMQFLLQSRSGSLPTAFPILMGCLLVAVVAVVIPQTLVRIRRARAYAARHRDLLDEPEAGTAA